MADDQRLGRVSTAVLQTAYLFLPVSSSVTPFYNSTVYDCLALTEEYHKSTTAP